MVADIIRDAPLGQFIRFITKNKVLQYPEERADFVCPEGYSNLHDEKQIDTSSEASTRVQSTVTSPIHEKDETDIERPPLSTTKTAPDLERGGASPALTRTKSLAQRFNTTEELTEAYHEVLRLETIKTQPSKALKPEKTADNRTLVTWYTTDDPANPQNWSPKKKAFVILQIYFYTLAVYIASAIYTPSAPYLVEKYHLSAESVSTGLSMYVVGYGLGALFFR